MPVKLLLHNIVTKLQLVYYSQSPSFRSIGKFHISKNCAFGLNIILERILRLLIKYYNNQSYTILITSLWFD